MAGFATVVRRALYASSIAIVAGNASILAMSWYLRARGAGRRPADVPIKNYRRVDDRVTRGAAPSPAGIRALAASGVRTVVDLRAERDLVAHTASIDQLGLVRHHLPVRDGQIPSVDQARRFLEVVDGSDGGVFVHCGAGVGRTGAMTAYYLNASGGTPRAAARSMLEVGPPSLEQIAFCWSTAGGGHRRPPRSITILSRVLDAPRRTWHHVRPWVSERRPGPPVHRSPR